MLIKSDRTRSDLFRLDHIRLDWISSDQIRSDLIVGMEKVVVCEWRCELTAKFQSPRAASGLRLCFCCCFLDCF